MTKQELLNHLQDIEWDNFEVKKAAAELPKNSWETVSAFANTSGGWLVLGVSQNGKKFTITGVENMGKLEQDLATTLRSRTKFNTVINPCFKKYDIAGKKVLACFIASSEVKPVYFNGLANTFIRTGSGDQRASEFEINALYRDQSFGTMSEKTAAGTSVKSLNQGSYGRFRDYLKWRNPDLRYNQLSDAEFNRRLKIVKDGKLTYGGLLFLGKNEEITDTFSDFRVDYLEIPAISYAGAEPRYTFRMDEQENLWEYYFALFQRLKIYADNPLTIGEMGIGREDTKQADALREALVNLLIHTDYFSPMKPRIRVFTNRIEFENPGMLPRPVEELLKADESLPRNPVLARFFRIAKLCESAGFGFGKMLDWKNETGNEVAFETHVDKTKFTFMLNEKTVEKTAEETVQKTVQKTEEEIIRKQPENNQKTVEKTTRKKPEKNQKTVQKIIRKQPENRRGNNQKTVQKTTRKQPENCTENNQKTVQKTTRKQSENRRGLILTTIQLNPGISRLEMVKTLNITEGSLRHHLEQLKIASIIRREGGDKGGKWVVVGNGKTGVENT